jgi:sRNA-binding carbon storage regulator CsrA
MLHAPYTAIVSSRKVNNTILVDSGILQTIMVKMVGNGVK